MVIDLSKSKCLNIPTLSDTRAKELLGDKGWTLPNIYFLEQLKDVYLAIFESLDKSKKDVVEVIIDKINFHNTINEKRLIDEYLNALKSFRLVDYESPKFRVIKNVFQNSALNAPLTAEDRLVFEEIFFNYVRFKELQSWFLDWEKFDLESNSFLSETSKENLQANSKPLFYFHTPAIKRNREPLKKGVPNTFIYKLSSNTNCYYIDADNDKLMRFWEVFMKWGTTELGLLEKFNLSPFDVRLSDNRTISCVYFISQSKDKFDLLDFIKTEMKTNFIHIPTLILKLALKYRFSVKEIKKEIIVQSLKYSNNITLQRTSEIFIKGRESIFPQYKNAYISHLLIR